MSGYVPATYPHRWLPEKVELKTWDQIEPWYRKLMDEPIASARDLERWMITAGELNAAVGEEGVKRDIAMTCQTDDPGAKRLISSMSARSSRSSSRS